MKRFSVAVLFAVFASHVFAWSHTGASHSTRAHTSRLSTRLTHIQTSASRSHWGTLRRK